MPSARTLRTTEKGDWRVVFLTELAANGNVGRAAKKARVARSFVYARRQNDAEFAAAWDEALDTAIDAMEYEGWRRSIKGTLKPVFYKGDEVGAIREYSDTLLIFFLKAARPEKYRERYDMRHSGSIDVRNMTDDELRAIIDED